VDIEVAFIVNYTYVKSLLAIVLWSTVKVTKSPVAFIGRATMSLCISFTVLSTVTSVEASLMAFS